MKKISLIAALLLAGTFTYAQSTKPVEEPAANQSNRVEVPKKAESSNQKDAEVKPAQKVDAPVAREAKAESQPKKSEAAPKDKAVEPKTKPKSAAAATTKATK